MAVFLQFVASTYINNNYVHARKRGQNYTILGI